MLDPFQDFYYNNEEMVEENISDILKAAIIGAGVLTGTPDVQAKVPVKVTQTDSNTFYEYMASVENGIYKGWNKSKQLWYPHASVEGGAKTIAYGHKIKKGEDYSKGITHEQSVKLLVADIAIASGVAKKVVDGKSGAGTYDKLSSTQKEMLIDFAFNGGRGLLLDYKTFVAGVVKNDVSVIAKHYHRNYTKNGKLVRLKGRNDQFAKRFLAGSNTTAPKTSAKTYKIKKGDTLGHIAQRNKIKLSSLLKVNPDINPKRLQIGQQIQLP